MKHLLALVDEAIARHGMPWRRSGAMVDVALGTSGRRQRVHLERRDDRYRFWSVVARAALVTQNTEAWRDLAYRAWRKNALKEVIGFAFDRDDRLIGVVEHPAATLDHEELVLQLEIVARECDRFEHKLTGADRE